MATPIVYDVTKKKRYVFKKHPFKSTLDDLEGPFSHMPTGVMHVEDIRVYIYCKKELFGLDRLRVHMDTMLKLDKTFLDEYAK